LGDFGHRVTDTLLRSEFLPVRFRIRLMRAAGYVIDPSACLWAGVILRSKKTKTGSNVFINIGFVTILPSSPWLVVVLLQLARSSHAKRSQTAFTARVVRTLPSFAGSVCPEPVC